MLDQRFLIRRLSNLRYAGEDAQVLISLSEAEGRAQIRVKDDGPGFPPDLLDHAPSVSRKGTNRKATDWDSSSSGQWHLRMVDAPRSANSVFPGGAEIIVELPSLGRYPDPHFARVDTAHELLWRHVDANK